MGLLDNASTGVSAARFAMNPTPLGLIGLAAGGLFGGLFGRDKHIQRAELTNFTMPNRNTVPGGRTWLPQDSNYMERLKTEYNINPPAGLGKYDASGKWVPSQYNLNYVVDSPEFNDYMLYKARRDALNAGMNPTKVTNAQAFWDSPAYRSYVLNWQRNGDVAGAPARAAARTPEAQESARLARLSVVNTAQASRKAARVPNQPKIPSTKGMSGFRSGRTIPWSPKSKQEKIV